MSPSEFAELSHQRATAEREDAERLERAAGRNFDRRNAAADRGERFTEATSPVFDVVDDDRAAHVARLERAVARWERIAETQRAAGQRVALRHSLETLSGYRHALTSVRAGALC